MDVIEGRAIISKKVLLSQVFLSQVAVLTMFYAVALLIMECE